ncbi:Putative ribonuclease H protein At1g65750 [Linum perenne]
MEQKLTGWKASSLSLVGRVTLAQSVLSAIPSFIMQTSVLPSHIYSEIDKKAICIPKSKGGLGLRSARQLNQAYMMKLGFLFLAKPEELWVQVLQTKYFKDEEAGFRVKYTNSKSAIWRGILAVWPKMTEGVRSGLRNGGGTLFWTNRWIDSGEWLIDSILPGAPDSDFEATSADFCTPSGEWDLPIFVLCYQRIWCFRLQVCHRRRRIEGMRPHLGVSKRMDASGSVQPMTSLVSMKDEDGMSTGSSSGDGRGQ